MAPSLRIFARTIGLGALLCATGAGAADASQEATAARLAQAALTDPTSYGFLEALTTEVGQRLAGTEAHARAVTWAQARLKAMGFENVHAEPFSMTAWTRGIETAQVVSPYPQALVLTALGGSVATPPEGVEAEIAVFHTLADLLAASPGSLTGKIAVVTERMVRAPDGSGYGPANPIRRAGPSEAAKRGAIAYLARSLSQDDHRLAHAGATNYAEGAPRIPAAAISSPDADQLERLTTRGPVRLKLVLTPQSHPDAQSWNVVGEVKGSEHPDQIVLIGAHLDSWDLATGATDDGAGDAIVVTAAKLIAGLPKHPKRTIRVVLFGAEEMDFSGKAYAKAHEADASHIVIAGESDFGARNVFAFQVPPGTEKSDFTRDLKAALTPLGIYLDPKTATNSGDDIRALHAAGVPVLSMRQDGHDYFSTHHTADDTLDKVDPKQLAQATGAWAAWAYLAADTDLDFRAAAASAPQ